MGDEHVFEYNTKKISNPVYKVVYGEDPPPLEPSNAKKKGHISLLNMGKKKDDEATTSTAPNDDKTDATPTINVHTGFYEYLFAPEREGSDRTRLQSILDDVKIQLEKNPGYALYCTGHSLGGALSTLAGFFAACDEHIVHLAGKVVVYSIASPYCGNWKFRQAFQQLERRRRLQHLRIANLEDMVTLLPFAVPKATLLSPALSLIYGSGNLYKHVGIKLQLKSLEDRDNKKAETYEHSLFYSKEHQSEDDTEYAKELQEAMEAGKSLVKAFFFLVKNDFATIEKYHSCVEYEKRLDYFSSSPLTGRTLDDLYQDPTLVGKSLLDSDFRPSMMGSGMSRTLKAFSVWGSTRPNSGSGSSGTDKTDGSSKTRSSFSFFDFGNSSATGDAETIPVLYSKIPPPVRPCCAAVSRY